MALTQKQEAVIIIVWYAIYSLCYATMHSLIMTLRNYITLICIVFVTAMIFYTLLGLIGEVFVGRCRLINFSMLIQWIAMIMSTFIYALKFAHVYDLPQWLGNLIVVVPLVVQVLGFSAFQITAVQFGTDQLLGAPSEQLTAFIFWYFCMEQIPRIALHWVFYLLSNFVTDFSQIQLGCCLFCVILLSFIICAKSCFMTNWFSLGDLPRGTTCMCRNRSADHKHNPYSLVYRTIKFALKHEHPLQRSALTYWEDEIPSRIDLGKSKYGGPFTSEEVENVKTFFQLIKVLISLSGILITSFLMDLSMYHRVTLASDNSKVVLTRGLSDAVILVLLVSFCAFLFLACCRQCLPRMLKRIWLGAVATAASALSILLIESIGLEHQQVHPCYLSFDSVALSPYLLLIPSILCTASYTVFITSL